MFVAMFALFALTAVAAVAQADTGRGCGEYRSGRQHRVFKRMARKLGLTDAQKAQAKAIFQANRETTKPMRASLRAERKNLRALIQADTIDEAAIRAETTRIAAIQADLNVNRAKVAAQFRAILTPDQLAKLKELRHHRGDELASPPPAPAD